MKKQILFAVLIAALVLAACQPAAAPAPAAPTVGEGQPAENDNRVEVIWYVRSNEREQKWENETVIPAFEAQNPGIKINLIAVPWADFDTKMDTMISAGTPPDIWSHWGPSGFADYVQRGLVADLTPFIEKDNYDLSDFLPEVLSIYEIDGKIMGLPILTTGSYIFYNKDLFDAAGVDYPPTDWNDKSYTWEKFLEQCKALTRVTGSPETDVYGCNLGVWPNDQYAWIWGQDLYPDSAYESGVAEESYLDSPAAIEAFQARQDIVWDLNYMPDPAEIDAFGGGDIFKSQKVAMHVTGGWGFWNFSDVTFNWGVAVLPIGGEGRKPVIFTDPWLMSSQTSHPEEAWTFLKYLASAEVQKQWSELNSAPPVRKSLLQDWYSSFPSMTPEEVKEVFDGSLAIGRESPNHLLMGFNQLDQVVTSAIDPIINNEKNASETLPASKKQLDEALKQIKAQYEDSGQ